MTTDDEYEIDRRGGRWDGVWRGRGRSSSQRRNLANATLEAARFAALMAEVTRLIDAHGDPRRKPALAAIKLELSTLRESILAVEAHLDDEVGTPAPAPLRRNFWQRTWRAVRMWVDRKAMGAP